MPRLALAALAACLPLSAEVLVDTDFAGGWQTVTGNPRVTGSLPSGWRENSSWAGVWIDYRQMREGDRSFLRVGVTRVDNGQAQIYYPLPRAPRETYIRLSVTVRDPDRLAAAFGVRRLASPYNFLWQVNRGYAAGWRQYTWLARLDAADYDAALFLLVYGPGAFDVSQVRLERLTVDEIREEFLGRPAGPVNLSRVSRFPLGLQSGWTLDRDSSEDDVRIAPDGGVRGPSGAPALRVESPRAMQIYSAPVALPVPVGAHTASIYVKGRGSGAVTAIGDGRALAQGRFTAGPEWQRIEVRFTPSLLGRVHGVRLEASGDMWFDAFQLERGERAGPYQGQGRSEVSLAVDSETRVHFDDEPATVQWAVTGEGGVLKARVANLYGEEHSLAPVRAGEEFAMQGEFRYDVFPARPYGGFRVEAWVEDAEGRRLSPFSEIVVYRLRRPRYWMQDAPDSPFGAHLNSTRRHILMAKSVGVNWTRLHDAGTPYIGWYHLERKPGEWSFRDTELDRYRWYGLKILGAFATAPEWASFFDKPRNGYYDRYYQPRNLDEFANYVRTAAARYRGVIDTYDLWNEPWGAGYWAVRYDEARKEYVTSADPQADFARLTSAAAEAAKSVDAGLAILGVNSTTGGAGAAWTRGVLASGGLEPVDIACYHQYTSDPLGFPGDAVEKGFQAAMGGIGKPIWMTEGSSVYGLTGNGLYRHTLPYDDEDDFTTASDRLARYVVGLLAQGVRKVFLYSMHTHVWFGMGNEYRVLVTEDGYLHPSAAAHSAMAWLLEGTHFAGTGSLAEGLTGYRFRGENYTVTVLSPRPGHAPYMLPGGALDLYGNPVSGMLGNSVAYVVSPDAGR